MENSAQLELLKQQHCDISQGHLHSKPIPLEDFCRLLEQNLAAIPTAHTVGR